MICSNSLRCGLLMGAALLAPSLLAADGDPQAEYQRRAAERYVTLFTSLDLDGDGRVSRAEAKGDLSFAPRFDDMDINRDNIVTATELRRFIEIEHGLRVELKPR